MSAAPEITSEDLRVALANALHFAGRDYTLPVLNSVRLEFDGTTLTAIATDRYAIGIATAACTAPPGVFLLGYGDAADLVRLLKSRKVRGSVVGVDLALADGVLTVVFSNLSITYRQVAGEYPVWRKIVEDADAKSGAVAGYFNPQLLGRLAKVEQSMTYPIMSFDLVDNMARAAIGENFRAYVMQMRPSLKAEKRAA
jgi:hypothetical protein